MLIVIQGGGGEGGEKERENRGSKRKRNVSNDMLIAYAALQKPSCLMNLARDARCEIEAVRSSRSHLRILFSRPFRTTRFNSTRSTSRSISKNRSHGGERFISYYIRCRFLWKDPLVTLQPRIWTIADGKKEFYWQESRYITFRGNSRLLERVSYNAKRRGPVIYGF